VNDPSRGIAIIQTRHLRRDPSVIERFNPSRGIAIIQTWWIRRWCRPGRSFNPSRGIAIIQTSVMMDELIEYLRFQSLTRDSNHSNKMAARWG